jgi:hypothetical protein
MAIAQNTSHDPELLHSAERVLERHHPHSSGTGRSVCEYCAEIWPCPSALSASQAAAMAGGPLVQLSAPPQRQPGNS